MNPLLFILLMLTGAVCITSVSGQCSSGTTSEPLTTDLVIELANGSSQFALSLFKTQHARNQKARDDNNLFIGPISVWSALILTYWGSKGNTATELAKVLRVDQFDRNQVNKLYTELKDTHLVHNSSSDPKGRPYTFKMANKLYFDQEVDLQQCVASDLGADIERAQFAKAPEEWRVRINKWVEQETNDRIKELLPVNTVDFATKMVIVNAAYFKDAWAKPFSAFTTTKQDFFVKPNKPSIKVDMMKTDGYYFTGSSSTLGCSAIVLPYHSNAVSMIVLLPDGTVEDLVPKLTVEALDNLLNNVSSASVALSLPKFKIEDEMDLVDTMADMGVVDLFSPVKADLSGFETTKKGDLFVDSIRHKTFIAVNEEGTEAAAATAVTATRSGGLSGQSFVVNKPFVFVIRHNIVGSYLFMGLIKVPTYQ